MEERQKPPHVEQKKVAKTKDLQAIKQQKTERMKSEKLCVWSRWKKDNIRCGSLDIFTRAAKIVISIRVM